MRQKGCSFVTLRPLRNRGLILFREVNESKWTPEASALSRCNFLRFCHPNPAGLTSKNVDASGVQKRSFTSRKSIRPRYIGGVRERQPECSLLVLLCREHKANPRRFRTRAPRHLARWQAARRRRPGCHRARLLSPFLSKRPAACVASTLAGVPFGETQYR